MESMATTPLRKCSAPGCRVLVHGGRCELHCKRGRPSEHHRGSATERGYNYRWEQVSKAYRRDNPLCVECLFRNRVKAVQCVDHIISHKGRDGLMWDTENYCSLCHTCHSRKTHAEHERQQWEPIAGRYVVCGLPGAGKTTRAASIAEHWQCDVYDWDAVGKDMGIDTSSDITEAEYAALMDRRRLWLTRHRDRYGVLIVSRPFSAAMIAANMEARVVHVTCDENERQRRLQCRAKVPLVENNYDTKTGRSQSETKGGGQV